MSKRSTVAAVVVVGILVALAVAAGGPPALAHGSTQHPSSRPYACRFEQPGNPMCAAAWRAGEQALYDWMEVNIADADGRHQERIPDGRLCSAGRDKYRAFDTPGDWPLTALVPGPSGRYDVTFTSTAPHATAYYRLFVTRAGFDARTDVLRWSDLVPVHDSGPLPAATSTTFSVDLPARAVPAVLYVIWQRSDSPEAFYACSDVTIGGGGATSTTTTPTTTTSTTATPTSITAPPTTAPTTTPPPPPTTVVPSGEEPFSPVAGIAVGSTTTASWDRGRCVEIRVTNTTSRALSWEVHLRPGGNISSLWNATAIEQHHEGHEGHAAFVGESWNGRLAGGAWTTFGMCVDTR